MLFSHCKSGAHVAGQNQTFSFVNACFAMVFIEGNKLLKLSGLCQNVHKKKPQKKWKKANFFWSQKAHIAIAVPDTEGN